MKKCIICGARVRNQNPRTVTCDPICTKAKKADRTREQQIRFEMDEPASNEGHESPMYDLSDNNLNGW